MGSVGLAFGIVGLKWVRFKTLDGGRMSKSGLYKDYRYHGK